VSALGIFSDVPTDISTIVNNADIDITWASLLGITGIVAAGAAYALGSLSIIGIYLFSAIFWTNYKISLGILTVGNFIPNEFLTIFTIALVFIWVAAVIGMTTIVS